MKVIVNKAKVHIATGGKNHVEGQIAVVFLHGSGMDHRAWALQTRWFAFNGFNVIAPDFPGHSLSAGSACHSIEDSAQWLMSLLDALNVTQAHLIGHSQGFLTALEFAAKASERVLSLTGVGTAAAIPVNPALIESAKHNAAQAADMMLQWGFGSKMHLGVSPTPGMQPIGVGRQIMSNNPLAIDLQCCADYKNGDQAAQQISKPTAMLLADQDKMTPLKAGLAAADLMQAETHVFHGYGHMLPIEAPTQVLQTLKQFISKQH